MGIPKSFRRWLLLAAALLIVGGGTGYGYLNHQRQVAAVAPHQLAAAITQAKHASHSRVVTKQTKAGTVIYILPKNITAQSAALKHAAEAAMPTSGSHKTVVAKLATAARPLALSESEVTFTTYSIRHQQLRRHQSARQDFGTVQANGQPATVADLVSDDYSRRAINYVARQVLTKAKQQSADSLNLLLTMPLLANMQATNFRLDSKALAITNRQHKVQVRVPLTDITTYLHGQQAHPLPGKVIALTFDDGPNGTTTPQILKILAAAKVKATFFMVGTGLSTFPAVARQVQAGGHELGIHTYDHPFLPKLSTPAANDEINGKMAFTYYQVFGELPTLLRPPYGAIASTITQHEDLPTIQWATDSQDWRSRNARAIYNRINATAYPGSIILMHDIQPATVQALPRVIQSLKAQGYQFTTVSQLLGNRLLPGYEYFGRGDERLVTTGK